MDRILVAENEAEQAGRMRELLKEGLEDGQIVAFASDFGEAMNWIEGEEPAVAVLAINQNGVNGLELGRQIRQASPYTQLIFLSQCASFDFAREAMALGAVDYILKPVAHKEILVESIKRGLEAHKAAVGSFCSEERRTADIGMYLEHSFMYAARFNEDFGGMLNGYRKALNLGKTGYVMNIEVDSFDEDSSISLKRDGQMLYRYLKELVGRQSRCVVGPVIGNRVLVFIDTERKGGSEGKKPPTADVKLAALIIAGLKEEFKINVSIGLGSEKPLQYFYISYEEAIRCLRYRDTHNIVRIRDIERVDISHESYIKLESQMLKSIKFAGSKTIDLFAELLDLLRPLAEERRRNKIMELLVLAGHEARADGQDEIGFVNYGRLFDQYRKVPIEKMEVWACQNFEHILTSVSSNRRGKKSESIRLAIRYMEEYYMEPITLEEIAEYVGVTPQHFSKIFKKELGINFIQWLTNYRMDVAKELLLGRKGAIKEICYQVGYSDPNYFSRIFKKVVGMSPKEYATGEKKLPH